MRQSRQSIERELRRRILDGRYPPGSRLPLRRELLRELGASPLTLQRAMDRLGELGFIESRGTQGTFVAAKLPNRATIGLIFPGEPDRNGSWNRFWSSVLRVAEAWDEGGVTFRPYFLSDQHVDVPDHRRICADLADGGLMGVVSVSSPHYLEGSPIYDQDLPRVIIGSGKEDQVARWRSSWMDLAEGGVHLTAMRRLRAAGRQRIAFLTHPSFASCPWLAQLKDIGLATRPEWWIGVPPAAAATAQPVARLLCSGPEHLRPDALLITDDNLVPYGTAGVLDAGLHPPRDISVAAHANFPAPTHAAFPCLRFGVDVEVLLHACLEELRRIEAGGKPRVRTVQRVLREA